MSVTLSGSIDAPIISTIRANIEATRRLGHTIHSVMTQVIGAPNSFKEALPIDLTPEKLAALHAHEYIIDHKAPFDATLYFQQLAFTLKKTLQYLKAYPGASGMATITLRTALKCDREVVQKLPDGGAICAFNVIKIYQHQVFSYDAITSPEDQLPAIVGPALAAPPPAARL